MLTAIDKTTIEKRFKTCRKDCKRTKRIVFYTPAGEKSILIFSKNQNDDNV